MCNYSVVRISDQVAHKFYLFTQLYWIFVAYIDLNYVNIFRFKYCGNFYDPRILFLDGVKSKRQ
jgi:hypothetical protein